MRLITVLLFIVNSTMVLTSTGQDWVILLNAFAAGALFTAILADST